MKIFSLFCSILLASHIACMMFDDSPPNTNIPEVQPNMKKITAEDCFKALFDATKNPKEMKPLKEKYEHYRKKGSTSNIELPLSKIVERLEMFKDECSQESIYKVFEEKKGPIKSDPLVYKNIQKLYTKVKVIEDNPSRFSMELFNIFILLMKDIRGHKYEIMEKMGDKLGPLQKMNLEKGKLLSKLK